MQGLLHNSRLTRRLRMALLHTQARLAASSSHVLAVVTCGSLRSNASVSPLKSPWACLGTPSSASTQHSRVSTMDATSYRCSHVRCWKARAGY